MSPRLLNYERATSADLLLDPPSDDVLILCVAAPENHGPHLPLGTDAILTEEVARRLGERLLANRPARRVFLHPTWHLGGATIRGVGSVKVPSRLLRRALVAYLRRFVRQGFRYFVLLSTHGAPPHTGALDAACAKLRKLGTPERPVRAIAPSARIGGGAFFGDFANDVRRVGVSLSDDDVAALAWDLHGGRLETAMMLAADASLVDACWSGLPDIEPPRRRSLVWLQGVLGRAGDRLLKNEVTRRDFHRALTAGANDLSWIFRGRKEGYLGRPAAASAVEGEALLDAVSRDLALAIEDYFAGRRDPRTLHSAARLLTVAMALGAALLVGLAAALVFLLS